MYRRFLQHSIFILISIFVYGNLQAQRGNGIALDGAVTVQEGKVDGAYIEMYRDGTKLDNYGIGNSGSYKLELNYNHRYNLIFKRPGNFSQKIVVDASVPTRVLERNPRFPSFPVNINLFTEIEDIDNSFAENTVLKIYYNKKVDNFISERYYNNAQIKMLIDQAIIQSKMIDDESDYLARLTKAELEELRKEYEALLREADKEYNNEEFLNALDGYKAASKVFPKEQFPKDRIAEINDLLGLMMAAEELQKMLAERFNNLVAKANQLFDSKQYKEAKNEYNRALSIKEDGYVSGRIKEIDRILTELRKQKEYDAIIAEANQLFKAKNWNDSRGKYTEALAVKSNESYPQSQIAKIDAEIERLAKVAENNRRYEESMKAGDANFEEKEYSRALLSYKAALEYKPNDKPAQQKIEKTQKIIADKNQLEQYKQLIANADKQLENGKYSDAKTAYQKALSLQPGEQYPQNQIKKIDKIVEKQQTFNDLVAQANTQFNQQKYTDAKDLYQQALKTYPKNKEIPKKIDEIDRLIAQQGVDKQYNDLIASADKMFEQKNYTNAKEQYGKALKVKSKERYPKEQIDKIDDILRDIEKNNAAYQKQINLADRQFKAERYDDARSSYNKALAIKDAPYPKEMIAKIAAIAAQKQQELAQKKEAEQQRLAAEKDAQKARYQKIVDDADTLADKNELIVAVGKFREALDVLPNEQYPIQRIEEIRGIIEKQRKADENYTATIKAADKLFKNKDYQLAIAEYKAAKQIKPSESYPQEMIAKTKAILAKQQRLLQETAAAEKARLAAKQAAIDEKYNQLIAKAYQYFKDKEYEKAKSSYQKSIEVKPQESYPKEQITKIENLLVEIATTNATYQKAISQADKLYKTKDYQQAIIKYNEAQKVKPSESYPQEMITRIEAILAEQQRVAQEKAAAEKARLAAKQAAVDENYNQLIAEADQYFKDKEYEKAKSSYQKSIEVKPQESYPKEQITKIENLLGEIATTNATYQKAISQADKLYKTKDYQQAIAKYNEAQKVKPSESYPQEMITKIEQEIAEKARLEEEAKEAAKAALNKKYYEAIVEADKYMNAENFEKAKIYYQKAADIKQNEAYPRQRVAVIDKILKTDVKYTNAIKEADKLYQRKYYQLAKTAYEAAKEIKPSEQYPDEMIGKIKYLLAEQQRLTAEQAAAEKAAIDKKYNDAIAKADEFFNEKAYQQAMKFYEAATNIKPQGNYPKQQMDKIREILKEQAELAEQQRILEENYQSALNLADKFFQNRDYENATVQYKKALLIKPDEQYPQQQIEKATELQKQLELDNAYKKILLTADGFFKSSQWQQARDSYEKALSVKPQEAYPQSQIRKIDELLAAQQAKADAQKAAAEQLAKRQVALKKQQEEIKSNQSAVASEIDAIYNEYIQKADAFFENKEYNLARAWYYKAWNVKPEETYPPKQIDEINQLVASLLGGRNAKKYQEYIDKADEALHDNQLAVARGWYNQALSMKDNDKYALSQLKEIKDLVAKRLSDKSGKQFKEYQRKANEAKNKKEWTIARFWTKKALELQPDSKEMQAFLESIEKAMNK